MRHLPIQALRKKWKSESGVTIIFALVIFLISCLISMVIVTSALNNAQRIGRQREEQQASLAISSAAAYAKKLFNGSSASYIEPQDGTSGWWEYENSAELERVLGSRGTFRDDYQKFMEGDTDQLTWQIMDADNEAITQALGVSMDVKRDGYSLVVTIRKEATVPQGDGGAYAMSFLFRAAEETYPETREWGGEENSVMVTKYTWQYDSLKR